MKKYTLYLIISIIIIFIIILISSIYLNRKVDVTFTIRPDGKYKLLVDKKEYNVTISKTLPLSTGKQKVTVKADGYEDKNIEINVKNSAKNEFVIDMSDNKIAPNGLTNIQGISSNILKNYKLISITLYDNDRWLAATLVSKNNPDDNLAFAAKRENKKWKVAIPPAIEFDQEKLINTPKDISEYLNTFSLNFIGEPEEDGGV
jgi:hypothetical protein